MCKFPVPQNGVANDVSLHYSGILHHINTLTDGVTHDIEKK